MIKNGELLGTTKSELWVFTDAGIVQLKADKNSKKSAEARVAIQPDQKLKVSVQTGQADLIFSQNEKIEKIQISALHNVELSVPKIILNEKKLQELAAAVTQLKTTVKSELIIENPKTDTTVNETSFEVKGHLSAIGAQLLINGELMNLSEELQFTKKLQLNEGTNLVVFQLIRSDASTQFIRKTITLNKGP